jgi:capsid protein
VVAGCGAAGEAGQETPPWPVATASTNRATNQPRVPGRLALLEFRRRIEAYQHAVMVWQVCRRVWARWLDTPVMTGAIALPDYEQQRRVYLGCSWLPPKWDWVDPLKDARAEIEQIEAGLKSRTQALAERGYDADQVDAEIAADRARERQLGLSFGSAAGAIAEQPDSDPIQEGPPS